MAIPAVVTTADTPPDPLPETHRENHESPILPAVNDAGDGDKPADRRLEVRLEDGGEPPMKKVKRMQGEAEMVLRQTAEIVMVLVGMASLRGGAPASPIECRLAAEAYEKLATLVEHVAPQDLVSKDSLRTLMQQLTLPQIVAKPITIQPTPTPEPPPVAVLTSKPTSAPTASTASLPPAPDTSAKLPEKNSSMSTINAKAKTGRTSPVKAPATRTTDTQTAPTTVTIKGGQAPKALARQRGAKNVTNQPVSDQQQTHQQLALAVHLLLKQDNQTPALPKAASAYMSPPVPCATCKLVVNDTNSVLLCDGCETGFHVLCLQLQNSVPKSDWYCPKCVMANSGRPQPPKYGPLRRGQAGQSGPRNSWSMQGGCGSELSKGQLSGKPLLQLRRREVDVGAIRIGTEPPAVKAVALDNPKNLSAESSEKTSDVQVSNVETSSEDVVVQEAKFTDDCQVRREPTGAPSVAKLEQDTGPGTRMQDAVEDGSAVVVDWVGPVVNVSHSNVYYAACSVAGVTIRLQDTAFFRPETAACQPYIARLQALWEEKSSGQKWVKVNWCYYPIDLPVELGRPSTSDPKEVYESNHSDNNLVGSIQGPCLVLPPLQYQKELERRGKMDTMEDLIPLFFCQVNREMQLDIEGSQDKSDPCC